MNKFNKIATEIKNRINSGEDNFIVDSWEVKKFGNEIVASKGNKENDVYLCISKSITSNKFSIQATSAYINIALESSMDEESLKKAMAILLADVHTEMYQQYDCRYAPDNIFNVDFIVRDCDIAAQIIKSTKEELFSAETVLA